MPPAGSIPGRADTCTTPSMYRVGVPNRLAVHRCVELFVGVHDAGGRGVGQAGCCGGHGDAVGAEGDGQGAHDSSSALAGDIGEQRRGWQGPERVGGDEIRCGRSAGPPCRG
jgi:hypothetical protein